MNGAGKYGSALHFSQPNEGSFLIYPANKNVAYSQNGFHGSLSFWMQIDASQVGGQYADPMQIGDKDASNNSIWVDFTKNDDPPDFRLGIFGNQSEWDVTNQRGKSEEFFHRLVKVAEPPFSNNQWTHVVVTWKGINETQPGRGRLYLNGKYCGATGAIRESLTWDIDQTTIRLGSGPFVGSLDDVAVFDRDLSLNEIEFIYKLDNGVVELHP